MCLSDPTFMGQFSHLQAASFIGFIRTTVEKGSERRKKCVIAVYLVPHMNSFHIKAVIHIMVIHTNFPAYTFLYYTVGTVLYFVQMQLYSMLVKALAEIRRRQRGKQYFSKGEKTMRFEVIEIEADL